MRKHIVPSIIAKTQKELEERLGRVKFAKRIQLDVMDGKFVKGKSLCFDFRLPKTNAFVEAHLMMKNPEAWIEKNHSKVSMIIVHPELANAGRIIERIRKHRLKAGIAASPKTSIEKIMPLVKSASQVAVMTVNPGKYGAKFIPKMLDKVKKLRAQNPRLNIEVDGGISINTIKAAANAGANLFVAGSFIQNSENPKKAYEKLKKAV